MATFQWRRFNFFDIARDTDGGALADALQDAKVTSSSSGRGHMIVSDTDGHIHFFDRDLSVKSFKAFERHCYVICQLKRSGLFLALGEDDPGVNPYLKIYDLDKPDKAGNPTLLRVCRAAVSGRVTKPVAMAAHENQSLLAVGYADGSVILFRGDLTTERGSRRKTVLENRGAVSGLSFRTVERTIHLFVATEERVVCVEISTVKDQERASTLEKAGCKHGLAIAPDSLPDIHFMAGREDGVYCYTPEGRGQCYAFDGNKVLLYWFRNYLVIVTLESATSNLSLASHETRKHIVTVFDVQNKVIALTAPMKPVQALIAEWGQLFVVTEDNRLTQMTENDIQSKLDVLFRKNFYDIAVKMAKSQHYDESGLVDIFRQYGDHLYAKSDFAGAIDNYIKTIGHLEPSYVIRKFLDTSRTTHLTEYLQALHVKSLANEDHTTLLLNCYTKLKEKTKLDDFVLKDVGKVDFDVDIGIKVCLQSGYTGHAIELARRHRRHEWYLRLQIEAKAFRESLQYIATLDFEQARANMLKYGAALMDHCPDETTDFLKRLCTDYKPEGADLVTDSMLAGEEDDEVKAASAEDFLHILVQDSSHMIDFLETTKAKMTEETDTPAILLEHNLNRWARARNLGDKDGLLKHENSIMKILRGPQGEEEEAAEDYDVEKALCLCQSREFVPGTIFLFEKLGLYGQILKHHFSCGNVASALETCRKFGAGSPSLWVDALKAVAKEGEANAKQMAEILEAIERLRLLTPLSVVNMLNGSPHATLGLVRDYLMRVVKADNDILKADNAVIEQYRADSEKVREKIDSLRNEVVVFRAKKCSACNGDLELPTVHFLCQCSYHEHCFRSYAENDRDCPSCHPENKKILDIISAQKNTREMHDTFHHQLNSAEDGFSVVADYCGRGVFRNPVKAVSELSQQVKEIAKGQDNVGPGAEARMRTGESGVASQQREQLSEARLRLQAGQSSDSDRMRMGQSEARLRRGQASKAAMGIPDSDARMRIAEARAALRPDRPTPPPSNPFGDDDSEEDLSESNPFSNKAPLSQPASSNPFGDPDEDYDEKLNPFG